MEKNISRLNEMEKMRAEGKTHAEIAFSFGLSRQRVHQLIGQGDVAKFRGITSDHCVYGNIRKWMNDNKVSRSEFTRIIYGENHPENSQRLRRCLMGLSQPRKNIIDKILLATGMTYEEAFYRE